MGAHDSSLGLHPAAPPCVSSGEADLVLFSARCICDWNPKVSTPHANGGLAEGFWFFLTPMRGPRLFLVLAATGSWSTQPACGIDHSRSPFSPLRSLLCRVDGPGD